MREEETGVDHRKTPDSTHPPEGARRKGEKTPRELVDAAEHAARHAHEGQKDRAGNPYVDHLARVAHQASLYGHAAWAAAWLHDAVEDTVMTAAEIHEQFGEKVCRTVSLLTRTPFDKTYAAYISKLVEENERDALVIKLEDIYDHALMTPESLNPQLAKRYLAAYRKLEAATGRRWRSRRKRIAEAILSQIAELPDEEPEAVPNLSTPPTATKAAADETNNPNLG